MNALTKIIPAFFFASLLLLAACEPEPDAGAPGTELAPTAGALEDSVAVARIEPLGDSGVQGEVTFRPEGEGVRVEANLTGLSEGEHGFHVHENGDCSDADTDNDGTPEPGGAAGGHFNPNDNPHGAPTDPAGEHHLGDMGNITANTTGEAQLDDTFDFLTLGGPEGIVGKALVVHGGRDDLTSQPSGDAGPRVGCGVIELSAAASDTTGQVN